MYASGDGAAACSLLARSSFEELMRFCCKCSGDSWPLRAAGNVPRVGLVFSRWAEGVVKEACKHQELKLQVAMV